MALLVTGDVVVLLHPVAPGVVLDVAGPFLLLTWAEQRISSALPSIDNASTPLMTMLVASPGAPRAVERSVLVAH